MNAIGRDELNRTAKVLMDGNQANNIDDAYRRLNDLVLQVEVGPDIATDLAAQAALLTTLNTGHRAMLGGVQVAITDNPDLSLPWARGQKLVEAIGEFGGVVVDQLDPDRPALRIGTPLPRHQARHEVRLNLAWHGWCGGVSDSTGTESCEPAIPLAGVVAGALGISELFQHLLGSPIAARRTVGLSLWRPDLGWRSSDALGPALQFLPNGLWLLGLGHLGQANAWNLGCLPYERPEELEVFLVEFDQIIEANWSTGLLTDQSDIGRYKTRVVQAHLEALGHRTRLAERRFDDNTIPLPQEPGLALAGFDKPEPRRALGKKFSRVVDAGLGAGPTGYLDMLIHSFPSQLTPMTAFEDQEKADYPLAAAYESEISQRTGQGEPAGDALCGVIELAGATAAASFVGAIAGALSVADLLRILHGGRHYATISLDLRSPDNILTALAIGLEQPTNPGFAPASIPTPRLDEDRAA
ncbi:hypothetical protein [Candidatus Poriferisodalis sp.]|uniref:hypothetical protein n=1 Tax=Candidatus Poriferisodalis sp. TaxID=3101277 RepID=UPI003B5B5F8E